MIRKHFYKLATQYGSLQTRSMFGGTGIFHDNVMYALVRDGAVYLRSFDNLEPRFIELGCCKFQHVKKTTVATVNYYNVTEFIMAPSPITHELIEASIAGALADDKRRRCQSNRRLRDLPNLQLTIERMVKKAGISDVTTLMEVGAANAFSKVCNIYGRDVDVKLLWKLAGAVDGVHWELIQEPKRQQLLDECRSFGYVAI
ncbi:TfoX/Sxy family DNA transformation protein [Vibrio nitrifigilis]|uniref:TfoX/Sxy family DNA transformation protein n=1 Tax=Vibrio nitrifigilis TaxID=2789781 RepID=A0ABS0GCB8_9VIBR|nr:TfoX/Sxy family DNA transformation protein [Vibrio nitrifigilis]MBF9000052.1 TfoX/Sxy family DNA transformation protein [Vibrio nitrifigilis]